MVLPDCGTARDAIRLGGGTTEHARTSAGDIDIDVVRAIVTEQ